MISCPNFELTSCLVYIPYKCADSGLPRTSLCWPNGSQYSPVLPSVDPVPPRAEPIQPNVSQSFPVLTQYSLCWPSDSQSFPVLPQFFPVPPSTDPSSWLLDQVMRKWQSLLKTQIPKIPSHLPLSTTASRSGVRSYGPVLTLSWVHSPSWGSASTVPKTFS